MNSLNLLVLVLIATAGNYARPPLRSHSQMEFNFDEFKEALHSGDSKYLQAFVDIARGIDELIRRLSITELDKFVENLPFADDFIVNLKDETIDHVFRVTSRDRSVYDKIVFKLPKSFDKVLKIWDGPGYNDPNKPKKTDRQEKEKGQGSTPEPKVTVVVHDTGIEVPKEELDNQLQHLDQLVKSGDYGELQVWFDSQINVGQILRNLNLDYCFKVIFLLPDPDEVLMKVDEPTLESLFESMTDEYIINLAPHIPITLEILFGHSAATVDEIPKGKPCPNYEKGAKSPQCGEGKVCVQYGPEGCHQCIQQPLAKFRPDPDFNKRLMRVDPISLKDLMLQVKNPSEIIEKLPEEDIKAIAKAVPACAHKSEMPAKNLRKLLILECEKQGPFHRIEAVKIRKLLVSISPLDRILYNASPRLLHDVKVLIGKSLPMPRAKDPRASEAAVEGSKLNETNPGPSWNDSEIRLQIAEQIPDLEIGLANVLSTAPKGVVEFVVKAHEKLPRLALNMNPTTFKRVLDLAPEFGERLSEMSGDFLNAIFSALEPRACEFLNSIDVRYSSVIGDKVPQLKSCLEESKVGYEESAIKEITENLQKMQQAPEKLTFTEEEFKMLRAKLPNIHVLSQRFNPKKVAALRVFKPNFVKDILNLEPRVLESINEKLDVAAALLGVSVDGKAFRLGGIFDMLF